MLSQILLRIASTRFWNLLLLYISALILIIAIGAAVLGVASNQQSGSSIMPILAPNFLIESAANTLGLGNIDVSGQSQLITIIALSQGFIGILFNGLFVALVVFRAIRINHRALVFANHVLLSQQPDGKWRLEFRICNDSRYDIVNVAIKVQLVEHLETFPRTTAHKTSKVVLNYDEYLLLAAHGYLLVSSGPNFAPKKAGERIAKIDESLLSRRFFLRVLVKGQYLISGFDFSEFRIYDAGSVHKGHWRYYLREDLEKRGRILLDEFSAFDLEKKAEASG
jgi:hypothetical protein